jgi:nucleoside-triphosphatase
MRLLNIFITGPPRVGKTTVVKQVMHMLEERGFKAGGIFCPEIRNGERRLGFEVVDVLTGHRGTLSHIHQFHGPRVGKYRVNLDDFSRVGIHAIEAALDTSDFIVIDEVGPMELQESTFPRIVAKALASSKPVLGVIHWRMRHPDVDRIRTRGDVRIYDITYKNRETIPQFLVNEIQKALESSKPAPPESVSEDGKE